MGKSSFTPSIRGGGGGRASFGYTKGGEAQHMLKWF